MPDEMTTQTEEQGRIRLLERITLIAAVLGALSVGLYAVLYFQSGVWQILADAGLVAGAILCLIPARALARRGKVEAAGYWLFLAILLAYGGGALVWAGTAFYNALGGVLLIFLVATTIRPRNWGAWVLFAVLFVALIVGIEQFEPLPRYDIADSSLLRVHVPTVTAALVLLTLWQVVRAFRVGDIRTRLIIAFVFVLLIPMALLGVAAALVGVPSLQQQAADRMTSVAVLKKAELDTWVEDLQFDLIVALTGDEVRRRALVLLEGTADPSTLLLADSVVRTRFEQVIGQTGRYEVLSLLDLEGKVVLSTNRTQEGQVLANQVYFQEGLEGPYLQPPRYSTTEMRTLMATAQPVLNDRRQVLGVLVGQVGMGKLNEIMAEMSGLGETGETYLVGANHTLLTPTRAGELNVWIGSEGINRAVDEGISGSAPYDNHRGEAVVGAYRWLPELETALMAEQSQGEALRAIYTMLAVAASVGLLGVIMAIGAALLITRSIANPLADLAQTATQIASGDLTRLARVEREDEIGTLAQAFNSMTIQLRELIAGLEARVRERTQELEQRSAYLQASADVGRVSASILDRQQLLQQVVGLIREQFGLYYVGLFLLDETGQWAVLRAGAGGGIGDEGARAMLARGHRLAVGGDSMIGWCMANAQSRIALEAGKDAVRLATPELPDTRSEAALPLRSRGEIIGALTVQHSEPEAFDQDTVVVLQTMADQVAVALDNARLFAERQTALEATQRAYGEISREAWVEMLRSQMPPGFRGDERGVTVVEDVWLPEAEQALRTGRTVAGAPPASDGRLLLAVPIRVRGEVVGVLETHKPAETGGWTPEEITLLESIADQLDPALESARLYQDTQRRAGREQAIRQVTERMRRAVDIEAILQNTVFELAKALGAPRAYVRLGTEAGLRPALAGGEGVHGSTPASAYEPESARQPSYVPGVTDADEGVGGPVAGDGPASSLEEGESDA